MGVAAAFAFAMFSALNFLKMREIGHGVHSSVKTFYFGVLSSSLTAIFMVFYQPSIYLLWNFGKADYPMTIPQFWGCMMVGLFSWMAQESLSLALTTVKSGTTSGFYNIALVAAFAVDVIQFKREIFMADMVGSGLIFICTITQGLLANNDNKRKSD